MVSFMQQGPEMFVLMNIRMNEIPIGSVLIIRPWMDTIDKDVRIG